MNYISDDYLAETILINNRKKEFYEKYMRSFVLYVKKQALNQVPVLYFLAVGFIIVAKKF